MVKTLTTVLLLTINFLTVFGQTEERKNQQLVLNFIKQIKNQDKEKLSNFVAFPLTRKYPLPAIKNKQEFLNRYNEIFDDRLVKMIVNSNPLTDWSSVGYRGIMFLDGAIWLDNDGRLIAVNYQSSIEKIKRAKLISVEKGQLHESINTFSEPIIKLETTKYSIRIDNLGSENYRYASWAINSKKGDKPDLILEQGELIWEGSGGNHRYVFKHGDYVYDCSINEINEADASTGLLKVFKRNRQILKQNAHITLN